MKDETRVPRSQPWPPPPPILLGTKGQCHSVWSRVSQDETTDHWFPLHLDGKSWGMELHCAVSGLRGDSPGLKRTDFLDGPSHQYGSPRVFDLEVNSCSFKHIIYLKSFPLLAEAPLQCRNLHLIIDVRRGYLCRYLHVKTHHWFRKESSLRKCCIQRAPNPLCSESTPAFSLLLGSASTANGLVDFGKAASLPWPQFPHQDARGVDSGDNQLTGYPKPIPATDLSSYFVSLTFFMAVELS